MCKAVRSVISSRTRLRLNYCPHVIGIYEKVTSMTDFQINFSVIVLFVTLEGYCDRNICVAALPVVGKILLQGNVIAGIKACALFQTII